MVPFILKIMRIIFLKESAERKDIHIVPEMIDVSEAGMEHLTKTPIISGIGVDIKDMNQVKQIDSELQALNDTLNKDRMEL